jgi:hypothetical protein
MMRLLRSIRVQAAAAAFAAAGLLAVLAGASSPAAATSVASWVAAGTLTDTDQVTFSGDGLTIAPDGGGVLAWETYPDLETRAIATFAAESKITRVTLEPALAAGATQVVALDGGHVVIGGIKGGAANGAFTLQVTDARGSSSAPLIPGAAQHLQSQIAVMEANRAGQIAVVGASGAQPVLTVCSVSGGCGRTVALAPSTGVLSVNGGQARGTGLAVAIAADGSVVAAWVRNSVLNARWRTPTGRLGPTQHLARVHAQVWLAAAVSVSGRAALVWESQDDKSFVRPGPATSTTEAQAATSPSGGRFTPVQTLDSFPADQATDGPGDVTLSEPPVVAVAFDNSRPIAAWTGHNATGFTVRAADLDNLGSSVQILSPPGRSATLGALATAPNAGAVVAWLACRYNSQQVCWPDGLQATQAGPGQPFSAPRTLPGTSYDPTFFSADAAAAIDPTTGRPWVAATSSSNIDLFTQGAP